MPLDCQHLSLSAFSHNFMIQSCYIKIKIPTMRENNLMQLAKKWISSVSIFFSTCCCVLVGNYLRECILFMAGQNKQRRAKFSFGGTGTRSLKTGSVSVSGTYAMRHRTYVGGRECVCYNLDVNWYRDTWLMRQVIAILQSRTPSWLVQTT
jgi:hypothetical protein